jgi:predicted SprT family Zn-dependent metalloprotease
MKTIKQEGISKTDLVGEVKKAIEFLDNDRFHKWMSKIKEIKYNGRLRSSGGRVVHKRGELDNYRVEFNPALPLEEFEDTVRHEVAHIITGATDSDEVFKSYCREHGIRLSLKDMLKTAESYKYKVVCEGCKTITSKYKRNTSKLKRIRREPRLWKCGRCGEVGDLVVKEI